jgi:hypothetical protein
MGTGGLIEYVDKNDSRLYGKMLQSPVLDAVKAWNLAELKGPESCLKIVRVDQMRFSGMGLEV